MKIGERVEKYRFANRMTGDKLPKFPLILLHFRVWIQIQQYTDRPQRDIITLNRASWFCLTRLVSLPIKQLQLLSKERDSNNRERCLIRIIHINLLLSPHPEVERLYRG